MSESYWDENELVELFNSNCLTKEVHEIREKLTGDYMVIAKENIYDDEEVTVDMLREAVRKCVVAVAKAMPKVAWCIKPEEMAAGEGARTEKILSSIVPFRVTLWYSAFLPTGETYIDDEGETQPVTKQGHQAVVHALVLKKARTPENTSVKTYFLVIYDDDHDDPEYHLRSTKKEALELARRLADDAINEYGDMEHYPNEHTGENGWWFHESGEQCWQVTVREVEAD